MSTMPLEPPVTRVPMEICGGCAYPAKDDHPKPGKPHKGCVRAVRNGANATYKIKTCECPLPGCGDQVLRCTYCHSENQKAIDPSDWSCKDRQACRDRIQKRLDNNPRVQYIIEIRRIAMAKIANENAEKSAKAKATAAPKVGSCLHCGAATKGGNFLPGHDAAYVSGLVKDTLANRKNEAKNRKSAQDASASLGAKFDKSLRLADEKSAKKAAADKAKADEKATAKKATASASA